LVYLFLEMTPDGVKMVPFDHCAQWIDFPDPSFSSVEHNFGLCQPAMAEKSSGEEMAVRAVAKEDTDADFENQNELSLEDGSSWYGKIAISYLDRLFSLGTERSLQHEDLGVPSDVDRSGELFEKFDVFWQEECKKPVEEQRIWHCLWLTVGYDKLLLGIVLYAMYAASAFGPVLILTELVQYFQGAENITLTEAWVFVCLLLIVPIIGSLCAVQNSVVMAHIGVQIRNTLVVAIYKKSLKLSPSARQNTSTGQIVNMFSGDTRQLMTLMYFASMIVFAPAQIGVALYFIYEQVGASTFVGLGFMVFLIPINVTMFITLATIRKAMLKVNDTRVKLMNEILSGIRILKYYAWESPFSFKVDEIREKELRLLKKLAYVIAIGFSMILISAPIIQPILIFLTYIETGNQLDAAKAFTTIALFNLIRFPFAFLPMGLSQYAQAKVSAKRILMFLNSEELSGYVDRSIHDAGAEGDVVIEMNGCSLGWLENEATASKDKNVDGSGEENEDEEGELFDGKVDNEGDDTASNRRAMFATGGKAGFIVSTRGGYMPAKKEFDHQRDEKGAPVPNVDKNKDNAHSKKSLFPRLRIRNRGDKREGENKKERHLRKLKESRAKETSKEVARTKSDLIAKGKLSVADIEIEEKEDIEAQKARDENTALVRGIHTLVNMSFSIKKGELIAVVGAVGSGKSSLLYALLGELQHQGGSASMRGSVSFCDQKPWIMNDTLRGNVLFGLDFDEARFDQCLHAACLEDDIASLPGGEHTEIGEKGINLSGGQKARVALARCLYRNSDIVLLDDPLSAVDAHVCEHLFREAVQIYLEGKTRVLVTHQAHLLDQCDRIMLVKEGAIVAFDTYENIIESGIDVESYVPAPTDDDGNPIPRSTSGLLTGTTSADDLKAINNRATAKRDQQRKKRTATSQISRQESSAKSLARKASSKGFVGINSTEERFEGDVQKSAYTYYIAAGGFGLFVALIAAMSAGKALEVYGSFYLADWADEAVVRAKAMDPLTSEENLSYLNMYAMWTCMGVAGVTTRALLTANHRVNASRKLHHELLRGVVAAPTSFFDVTPIGRILNRFSSDMLCIDEELSSTVSQLINTMFNVFGALTGIIVSTNGAFLGALGPLGFIYYQAQKYFRASSTEIQRLASISLSPIYADFSQTLVGMSTIRAYGDEERFLENIKDLTDRNTVPTILNQLAFQWLTIRLDVIGAIVCFFVSALALSTRDSNFMPPGYLALGLTFSLDMTGYLKYAVRMVAQCEANMNSVERVMHYIEAIEPENQADLDRDVKAPPPEWPQEGAVTLSDVSMRYRDGPMILQDVSAEVAGGEKVGVAGRTGSGKSSLMVALFRIEPLVGGSISVDGIDTRDVPLHLLRKVIGIIPQDPVMFSASLRFNLDPFNDYSDMQIWDVLEKVKMKETTKALSGGLLEDVQEGGENFSAGQRQLICIARMLLRSPKILVLDEATASVDNETDASIQSMIREMFTNSTVLTIAHRLHTIIDCDKIMVLEKGNLAEFDSPQTLLERAPAEEGKNDGEGAFAALWARHQNSHGVHKTTSKGDLGDMVQA
jgi:ATP-binding cassette subfamily C (CFTR/MRP) protein 1